MKKFKFDFNEALGDTIMEKYEALYVKIVEISKQLDGLYCILTSDLAASIFETATSGFSPSEVIARIGDMTFCGSINCQNFKASGRKQVELYKTKNVVPNNEMILFGPKGSAVLIIDNFII